MEFLIKSLSAADTIQRFLSALEKAIPNRNVVNFRVSTSLKDGHLSIGQKPILQLRQNADVQCLLSELQSRDFIACREIILDSGGGIVIFYKAEGDFLSGKLGCSPDTDLKTHLAIADAFWVSFNLIDPAKVRESLVPADVRSNIRYHEICLSNLDAAIAKLGQALTQQADQLSKYLITKNDEMDKRFKERQEALEAEYKKRDEELKARISAFEKREAQFDARDRTVVRREIIQKMQTVIGNLKTTIKLSDATERKRWWVHALCGITLLASFALAATFSWRVLAQDGKDVLDWRLFLPLSAGTIVFVSTMIFYIKWSDDWFKQYAHAELNNRKFEADILRASWLAELYFEGGEKKDFVLPPELLAHFAQNLFQDAATAPVKHPFDQAISLLDKNARVKVSQAGTEVEFAKGKAGGA